MFEVGHDGGPGISSSEPIDDRTPSRRQYTLKGVEADTIRLMRDAANKEGMKIGSWVSVRMKEAAERALLREPIQTNKSEDRISDVMQSEDLLYQIFVMLNVQRDKTEERFAKVERELHEITSGQRTIMSNLLMQR